MNALLTIPVRSRSIAAARLLVRGQIQGIGFRPHIYRLAVAHHLTGTVCNVSPGVLIEIEGWENDLVQFREDLSRDPPAGARIDAIDWNPIHPSGRQSFVIERNDETGPLLARVPRDQAMCSNCRDEVLSSSDRRHRYAFTNCTTCGPRYSILSAMPYERPATAMRKFMMCAACELEYRSPADRRFHAEPIACAECGPRVTLLDAAGSSIAESNDAIAAAVDLLDQGQIIALKGLGGFQLLTPADDPEAIARLRQHKARPRKPFAIMVRDRVAAEQIAKFDEAERRLLESVENPIVLVNLRVGQIPDNIAPGLATVGLFLPTTPLHELLLERIGRPLVATSGNRGSEPIATDEDEARDALGGIADAFLVHDRPILRRLDDSVVRMINREPAVLRLGRGYAPWPLPAIEEIARKNSLKPIVATGAHLKSAIAVWTGSQAVLGAHIGDLDSPATRQAFVDSVRNLGQLYRFEPLMLVCDRHPDYFTTRWAQEQKLPLIQVQHHHAHAAACMAEHELLDREVLALVWDGTGLGLDNAIWGGEALRVVGGRFDREASLLPFVLPGGDEATRHPNRIAFALLREVIGERTLHEDRWLRRLGLETKEARLLDAMIARRTNCPLTSSIGRLFDAVAALVMQVREATYEGEAAIALESLADYSIDERYSLPTLDLPSDISRGDWRPMIKAIVQDLEREVPAARIASKFHNSLASWAESIAMRQSLTDIVLSGGCFQNRLLAERVSETLRRAGRRVYSHRYIPTGDGGLAVGQLAVAVMQSAENR